MRLVAFLVLVGTLGCGSLQTEYEWIQTVNGQAAKAPIVHTLRLEWTADTLTVRQRAVDANGQVYVEEDRWYDDPNMNCDYFDSDNWSCEFRFTGEANPQQSLKMVNGELEWFLLVENRKLKRKYRLFGERLPL